MVPSDETISALREALKVSPTNIPLHKHLAESLQRLGRLGEAVFGKARMLWIFLVCGLSGAALSCPPNVILGWGPRRCARARKSMLPCDSNWRLKKDFLSCRFVLLIKHMMMVI